MRIIAVFIVSLVIVTESYGQWQGTNPVWFTAGNVGVGTSSPGFKFHIRGSNPNSELMTLGSTTSGNFALTSADGGAYGLFGGVGSTGRAWLQAGRYDTNTAYDLLLQSSGGHVGIGVTNPQVKLDLGSTQNGGLQFRYDGTLNYRIRLTPYWNTSTDTRLDFGVERIAGQGLTTVMSVGYGNNVGIGTTTPQFKLDVAGQIASGYTYLENTIDVDNSYTRSSVGSNAYWDQTNNFWQIRPIGNNDFSAIIHPNCDGLAFIAAPSDGNTPKSLSHGQFMSYERMRISANGNVGVGITSPTAKLHVGGDIRLSGTSRKILVGSEGDTGDHLLLQDVGTGPAFQWVQDGSAKFSIEGVTGNVGIGTTTPDAKLTVKGDIHTREVKVDLNGAVGPDYVFEKDYKLPSLSELETYIIQNKHLPEVPSAKEMEANGLNLKEMNLLLLKKVEELTLHLIELDKQNKKLFELNLEQQQEIKNLKGK